VGQRVDVLLDRQHGVEEILDRLQAVDELVAPDAVGVDADGVEDLAVGVAEVGVVLEEIAVADDVRHHQLVLDRLVGLHQEGV